MNYTSPIKYFLILLLIISILTPPGVVGAATINVTIGETNILGTDDSGNGNLLIAQQATLSQPATIQSMSFYVATASGRLRLGIYDATGPSGGPGALKAQTAEFTPIVGWNTQNVVTPTLLNTGTYWLAYLPESSTLHFRMNSSGSTRWYSRAYGALPTTFSTAPQSGTFHFSFYATLSTDSVVSPTSTLTFTVIPTFTPTFTATNTPLPTATKTALPTATNTSLPTATKTALPTATNTLLPTVTNTSLPTATNTPLATATNTTLPTVTNIPTNTGVNVNTFAPKIDLTTEIGPTGVVIRDFDGDAKLDVAVCNWGAIGKGNTVSVFRNTGTNGVISFAARVDFTMATDVGTHGLAAGELDGDGKPDLVTANFGYAAAGTTISILRNTSTIGQIGFAPRVDLITGVGPINVSIADIDGDGKPDLAVANFQAGHGSSISIFRNTSTTGNLSFAPRVDVTTNPGPYGVTLGDVNGDGKPDMAVGNFGVQTVGDGNTVSVFRNISTIGTIAFAPKIDFTTNAGPRQIVLDDFEGDGKLDLAITNFGVGGTGNTVSVFRNTSTTNGNVSFAPKLDLIAGTGALDLQNSDFDGDGKPDLAVINYGVSYPLTPNLGTTVSIFGNTSTTGSISFAPKVDFKTNPGPHGIAAGDIDQNNKPDLAIVNAGEGAGLTVSIFQNTTGVLVNTPTATAMPTTTATPTATTTPSSSGTITMGEANILSSDDSGNGNLLIAQQATLSQPATIQSMSFYVTTTAGRLRLGIYDATGPSGGPGALKAQTAEFTPIVGWNTQNVLVPTLLNTGTYWLAYLPQSNSLHIRMNSSGSTRWYSRSYGALPTTFSTAPQSGTFHFSFYATLNTGSVASPTSTPTLTRTPTLTPTFTATNTSLPTATRTASPTATNTALPTATDTPLPTATDTPLSAQATGTELPTATNTPLPTDTTAP